MSKDQVKQIADALGSENIATACGVGAHSIRHAKCTGAFPSSWFIVVRGMCAEAGVDCPESAFSFKEAKASELHTENL